jgi:hypothetical protein
MAQKRGLFFAFGGITNDCLQPLDAGGKIIPGLYLA